MKQLYENILLKFSEDNDTTLPPILTTTPQNKYAIIIEPTYDKIAHAVIKNFMYFLYPEGWHFIIISYSTYKSKIKSDFPDATFRAINGETLEENSREIYFNKNGEPNITIDTYNKILLDPKFWNNIDGEDILIFQKDCIMFRPPPEIFSKYYSFSGANYYNHEDISPYYGGINGGFSLRKKTDMLDCLKNVSWNDITHYREQMHNIMKNKTIDPTSTSTHPPYSQKQNEDIFFTFACEILRKSVPDKIHRLILATEVDINIQTCVYHGWKHSYHAQDIAIQCLQNSPLFSKYITDNDVTAPTPTLTPTPTPTPTNSTQYLPSKSMPEYTFDKNAIVD